MEKVSLPIKTKIAVWWMTVLGLIFSLHGLHPIIFPPGGDPANAIFLGFFGIIVLVSGLLFFVFGILLFKKKKIGWYLSIIMLFIALGPFIYFLILGEDIRVIESYYNYYIDYRFHPEKYCVYDPKLRDGKICWKPNAPEFWFPFEGFTLLLPLILLLLDRKNFWKITA